MMATNEHMTAAVSVHSRSDLDKLNTGNVRPGILRVLFYIFETPPPAAPIPGIRSSLLSLLIRSQGEGEG
jgi:hypothetical protein